MKHYIIIIFTNYYKYLILTLKCQSLLFTLSAELLNVSSHLKCHIYINFTNLLLINNFFMSSHKLIILYHYKKFKKTLHFFVSYVIPFNHLKNKKNQIERIFDSHISLYLLSVCHKKKLRNRMNNTLRFSLCITHKDAPRTHNFKQMDNFNIEFISKIAAFIVCYCRKKKMVQKAVGRS